MTGGVFGLHVYFSGLLVFCAEDRMPPQTQLLTPHHLESLHVSHCHRAHAHIPDTQHCNTAKGF